MLNLFKVFQRNSGALLVFAAAIIFILLTPSFTEAACPVEEMRDVGSDTIFVCEPGHAPPANAVNISQGNKIGDCLKVCNDAGGTAYLYDENLLYCEGAQSATCQIGSTIINVSSGPTGTVVQRQCTGFWGTVNCAFQDTADTFTQPLDALKAIATYLVSLPFRLIAAFIGLFIFISAAVFGFLFSVLGGTLEIFISQILGAGVAAEAAPPVVKAGWQFSKDFVNLLFLVILAFIGLATILRLQTYQVQKLLPGLLIIAVLVNFSGVFVGLIVDVSNIITHFFIQSFAGFSFDHLGDYAGAAPANYLLNILDMFTGVGGAGQIAGEIIGVVITGLAMLLFYLFGTFILFFVMLIFIARLIVLWILTILAPFAFAAYILPATRSKFWNQWLQTLIQWSIVGIPLAFFLVLSKMVFDAVGTADDKYSELAPVFGETVGQVNAVGLGAFITAAFPMVLALALMAIGVFVSLTMAPTGARQIINFGKKAAAGTAQKTAGLGVGTFRGIPKVSKAEEKIRKRMEGIPVLSRAVGGMGAFEREKRKRMTEQVKPMEGLPTAEIEKAIKARPLTRNQRLKQAGLIEYLAKNKRLSNNVKDQAISVATKTSPELADDILKKRPDWAQDPRFIDPRTGTPKNIAEEMKKQEPEDFRKNVQKEAFTNVEVTAQTLLDRAKLNELGSKGKKEVKEAIKSSFGPGLQNHIGTMSPQERTIIRRNMNDMLRDPRWSR